MSFRADVPWNCGPPGVSQLLLVVGALGAGGHRGDWPLDLTRGRERAVADLALLVLLQVLGVVHHEVGVTLEVRPRLLGEMAEGAVAGLLLLLVAGEALALLGEDPGRAQRGLVEDGFVASEAIQLGLGVTGVVG